MQKLRRNRPNTYRNRPFRRTIKLRRTNDEETESIDSESKEMELKEIDSIGLSEELTEFESMGLRPPESEPPELEPKELEPEEMKPMGWEPINMEIEKFPELGFGTRDIGTGNFSLKSSVWT